MAPRKDKYVRVNFFEKLKPSRINTKRCKILDEPGFKLEDNVNGYRIYSIRQETKKNGPIYSITAFNGPEPKNILSSKGFPDFNEMWGIRKSALEYLKNLK